jgi:sulfonate transport system substrate-binding protein
MVMSIHIGAHPSNLTLTALAHAPQLQRELTQGDVNTTFHWYAEGRLVHDALDKGEINVVGTGSTRAIAAQADGVPINYVAASLPRKAGAAILVREDSTIHSAADLAGKRVGLIDGSFHTYFLVAALDAAGGSFSSVQPVNWAVKDSRRALQDGEIDAWVSSAPYLGPALAEGGLRSLIGCDKVIPNRSVFWLRKEVAALGKPVVEVVARSLADTDRWIAADPERAGHLFFKAIGGVRALDWARSVASRTWGLVQADGTVLNEQQAEADLLARHGLLSRRIDLADAALTYSLDLSSKAA